MTKFPTIYIHNFSCMYIHAYILKNEERKKFFFYAFQKLIYVKSQSIIVHG
jgi:hypothetical protein